MTDPRCPYCRWFLKFRRDSVYSEYNEWEGYCWNKGCKRFDRPVSPSEAGFPDPHAPS